MSTDDHAPPSAEGAAGTARPTPLSEEPIGTVDLPSVCVPPLLAGEELIARPVVGDSMTGDGICPGDVLLIARGRQPADRDIAVVHYTLPAGTRGKVVKHVRRSGNVLVLESSNPAYAPMVIEPGADPVIEGVVIGQLRKIRPAAPPAAPDEDHGPATSGLSRQPGWAPSTGPRPEPCTSRGPAHPPPLGPGYPEPEQEGS